MSLRPSWLLVPAFLVLVACGPSGIRVNAVPPQQSAVLAYAQGVSAVMVGIDASMPPDRTQILNDYQVPQAMQAAMAQSFGMVNLQNPQGLQVQVAIHHFRMGWGPARLGARVVVFDAAGQTVKMFEQESVSMRGGSRGTVLTRLAQDLMQKIASNI